MILPVHRQQEALVQRMFNFLQPGTYIRPHLHPRPFASESLVMLQGSVGFLRFDEKGSVIESFVLDSTPGANVIDFEPQLWHSFVVLEPDTVLFEVKRGPYDITEDKTFADWAPEEFTPEAEAYLKTMEAHFG